MKLFSYIVKHDKGLAPNPFFGYCTLAVCTPNHMGIRAEKGDWIAGFTTAARNNRLVYAMKVDERMHFNDYFNDPRFQRKKPDLSGSWKQRCGDNIYYQTDGAWCQLPSPYHYRQKDLQKDTKHPYVFIGRDYFYFGNKSVEMPNEFTVLIWKRQGCSSNFDSDLVEKFIGWLKNNNNFGKIGEPFDRDFDNCG